MHNSNSDSDSDIPDYDLFSTNLTLSSFEEKAFLGTIGALDLLKFDYLDQAGEKDIPMKDL